LSAATLRPDLVPPREDDQNVLGHMRDQVFVNWKSDARMARAWSSRVFGSDTGSWGRELAKTAVAAKRVFVLGVHAAVKR
jgi:hypothetical protein